MREGAERSFPKDGVAHPWCLRNLIIREGDLFVTCRSVASLRSIWNVSPLGVGHTRENPLCEANRGVRLSLLTLTLTYPPVAVPSREDLGETSYEWLSITDDEFRSLHLFLFLPATGPSFRAENRNAPKGSAFGAFVALYPCG